MKNTRWHQHQPLVNRLVEAGLCFADLNLEVLDHSVSICYPYRRLYDVQEDAWASDLATAQVLHAYHRRWLFDYKVEEDQELYLRQKSADEMREEAEGYVEDEDDLDVKMMVRMYKKEVKGEEGTRVFIVKGSHVEIAPKKAVRMTDHAGEFRAPGHEPPAEFYDALRWSMLSEAESA